MEVVRNNIMIFDFSDTNWLCPCVFKSGFSTLGYVYYYKKTGMLLGDSDNIFNHIRPMCMEDCNYPNLQDYKIFAVWRDPVKRFISLYTDMMTYPDQHPYFVSQVGIPQEKLLSSIDVFTEYALKAAAQGKDVHVNTLCNSLFTNRIQLKNVECFVPIQYLDDFIVNELKYKENLPRRNASNKEIDISGFAQHEDKIREVYKIDYYLYSLMKDKLYMPRNNR